MKSSVDPFDALASIFMRTDDAPVAAPVSRAGESGAAAPPATIGGEPSTARAPSDSASGVEAERGSAASAASTADRLAPVHLEALLPGHLPVRGSIWISPFVRTVSDSARPVALVRCDRGNTSIEVHGVERARGRRDERGDGGDDFEARLAEVRSHVRDWIVRPVPGDEPESVVDLAPDRVTVLTSGDQISQASCWEIIRRVIERADAQGVPRPRLAVAVVGAERANAESLVARLDAMAREQRDARVELRCCVPRIEPGAVADRVFDSPSGVSPGDIASLLRGGSPPSTGTRAEEGPGATARQTDAGDGPPVRPGADADRLRPSFVDQAPLGDAGPLGSVGRPPSSSRRPSRRAQPQDDLRLSSDGPVQGPWSGDLGPAREAAPPAATAPVPAPAPAPAPAPSAAPAFPRPAGSTSPASTPIAPGSAGLSAPEPFSVFTGAPSAPSPSAPSGPWPSPATFAANRNVEPPPSGPAQVGGLGVPAGRVIDGEPGRRPDLVTIVRGLRGLGPRCPGRESVELAVDAEGTLHVLGPVEAVADLPLVADWAITHSDLLAMACPEARFDPSLRPRGHVFTADPRTVADLLRTELHLHLLAPIDAAPEGAWYTVPLLGGRPH